MKNIKFRAFDNRSGVMHYNIGIYMVLHTDFINVSGIFCVSPSCKTLMQYTGIQDKNGQEIYEGDILTNTINQRRFISPKNRSRGYYRNQKIVTTRVVEWNDYWASWDMHKYSERGEFEVIGNIYQNKELLK